MARWVSTEAVLFTYIHRSLASLSILFKCIFLSFVNLGLLLHHVSIFWSELLYILLKRERTAVKVHKLWCKACIHSWNLSENVCLMCEDSFPIPLLCNLKYISLYLAIREQKAPASSWFPSELAMFLKIDPQCFGQFGTKKDFYVDGLCLQTIFPFLVTMASYTN